MLEAIRRHAYSWVVRVVFGFIVLVFMFWGLGSGVFNQVHPVATIDGQRVLPEQINQEAERIRRTVQSIYGANAQAVLRSVNLRQEALDQIVERQLVMREAKHLGLIIDNRALEQKIGTERAF